MLLPEKHIKISESLWGLGGIILKILEFPRTFDEIIKEYQVLDNTKKFPATHSINEVMLGLDLLFIIGAINFNDQGEIYRETN